MNNHKINLGKKTLRAFLRDIDMGKFAVPKLQREFVWDGPKAAKLLDSIYRGMPIGVVLIWETPKNQKLYLRQRYHVLPPFNDHNRKVWFLIDGQQRTSVLYHIKEGKTLENARRKEIDFNKVVFSLINEDKSPRIQYRKPSSEEFIPLCHILHPQWYNKLGYLNQSNKRKVSKCRERILNYGVHLMFVQMKIDEIRECFLRINTQGMKVSTADAIFTKAEGLDLRDVVHEVKQHLDDSFHDIGEMPILWSLVVTQGISEPRGQVIEKVVRQLENQANHDRKLRRHLAKEWMRLRPCFGKSVDYLHENFKVLNTGFLYSDYIVSILALFYFWNRRNPDEKQKNEIRKWFWATNVGSRYSGRNYYRCIPEDVDFFKKLAMNNNVHFRFSQQVDKNDVHRTQYTSHTGIGSAFYSLLLLRGPVSILDDYLNSIPLVRYSSKANRKDRHHIFPQYPLAVLDVPVNRRNSICNICLLTAEENQQIGAKRPLLYLGDASAEKRLFSRKMEKHLIPFDEDSGIWDKNIKQGFNRFIKNRENRICRAFEHEAGIRLFRRDT